MSQAYSQVQDRNWVSYPLIKYSHSTSHHSAKTYPWTHVNYRTDLELILRKERAVDEYGNQQDQLWMKIIGGAEVFENQNLQQLVRYCKEFDPSDGVEHPIQTVVKKPLIAMRYPKDYTYVRRIQLKFGNGFHFASVLDTIKELGLPVSYQGGTAPAIVQSRAQPSISPSPSSMSSGSTASATTVSKTLSIHSSDLNTPSGQSVISPTKSAFKVPLRPDSVSFETSKNHIELPFSTPQISTPISTSFAVLNGTPILPTKLPALNRPASPAPLYLSQIEKESQSRRLSQPYLTSSSLNGGYSRDNLVHSSQMNPNLGEHASEIPGSSPRLFTASRFFPVRNDGQMLEPSFRDVTQVCSSSSSKTNEVQDLLSKRPVSTPLEHDNIYNLWIPPKRELPFPKPRVANRTKSSFSVIQPSHEPLPVARATSTSELAKKKSLSAVAFEPTPIKCPIQRESSIPEIDARVRNDSPIHALVGVAPIKEIGVQEEEPSPLAGKSVAALPRSDSTPSRLVSKAIAPTKKRAATSRPCSINKRLKMVDQSTQTQTLSGRNHTVSQRIPHDNPTQDAATQSLPHIPVLPAEDYISSIESFVARYKARPAPQELSQTQGWAEADPEHREKLLNNFICENLENQHFIQLCKDTETTWRRIGLGM